MYLPAGAEADREMRGQDHQDSAAFVSVKEPIEKAIKRVFKISGSKKQKIHEVFSSSDLRARSSPREAPLRRCGHEDPSQRWWSHFPGLRHTSELVSPRRWLYVGEPSKKEVKDILIRYDRTLLVADPRRCEPKKFGGRGASSRFQKSYR
ncbi:hypothetical protein F2Q68_00022440 [Brassica cretica]|uniref:40S ribosomal protein S16 n=1 Tax=Brassica cretica TaxID=69181 RepID=A0A8S9FVX2_BRACR|nr:hypothetical protein F2Q68_00022440 [Brassica cretica]